MDIYLGKITLTDNQIKRLSSLNGSLNGAILGFRYTPSTQEIFANVSRKISVAEEDSLMDALSKISDEPPPLIINPTDGSLTDMKAKLNKIIDLINKGIFNV